MAQATSPELSGAGPVLHFPILMLANLRPGFLSAATGCLMALITVQPSCAAPVSSSADHSKQKPRVLVTSDGEIDDQYSLVRFLLYANEWKIEGFVTSSSHYPWHKQRHLVLEVSDNGTPSLVAYQRIVFDIK